MRTKTKSNKDKLDIPLIGEIPHKPSYDVRAASEGYSNIAAVLAGFAFAAIFLVIQIPDLPSNAFLARDRATVAFLVAFFGCLLSAFTFSIVKGEEILSPRSYSMALLGGCGFTISGNLVFWGLATLVKIFLSESIYQFIYYSFPFIMAFSLIYIAFSSFDPIISFELRKINWQDYALALGPAYTLLIPILIYKYLGASIQSSALWFNWAMAGALLLIIFSAATALYVSTMKDYKFSLHMAQNGLWIGFHAVVIGLLIFMI